MHSKYLAALITAAAAAMALGGCVNARTDLQPQLRALPTIEEPNYMLLGGGERPDQTMAGVRKATPELVRQLKDRLPTLQTDRVPRDFTSEKSILFDDTVYRRTWFTYVAGPCGSIHGSCVQNISLWLDSSGAIAQVFVTPLIYPL